MKGIIQTPTNSVKNSIAFYEQLNYTRILHDKLNLITDGKVIIEINEDRFARTGIKLFQTSWLETVRKLETMTTVVKTEQGYLLSGVSGVWIYLVEGELEYSIDLSTIQPSVLGNCAGVSLETISMDKSAELWEVLGFSKTMGSLEQGWIVYTSEDGMNISFMKPYSCPHLFFNPSLAFFNGKENLDIIQQIRVANIPITEEITTFNEKEIVDNIIIRDPGGLGFFLFND